MIENGRTLLACAWIALLANGPACARKDGDDGDDKFEERTLSLEEVQESDEPVVGVFSGRDGASFAYATFYHPHAVNADNVGVSNQVSVVIANRPEAAACNGAFVGTDADGITMLLPAEAGRYRIPEVGSSIDRCVAGFWKGSKDDQTDDTIDVTSGGGMVEISYDTEGRLIGSLELEGDGETQVAGRFVAGLCPSEYVSTAEEPLNCDSVTN